MKAWIRNWLDKAAESSLNRATVEDRISWRFSGRGLHAESNWHGNNARIHRRSARWLLAIKEWLK